MYTFNTLKKAGLLLSLIFGFILLSTTDISAQYGNYGTSRRVERDNRYGNNSMNIAQRYGYQHEFKDGADAAREGDQYHPQNSGDWQKGTNGYESSYRDRSAYKQTYRSAYLEGYRAGFQQSNDRGKHRDRDQTWRRNY